VKLGIIVNTNDPETAWNALRLGNEALGTGAEVSMFLLGGGVEMETIRHETFDVAGTLKEFLNSGGHLAACGTCLGLRRQAAGVCPISTMSELVEMISDSDKVVTFG
jgi:uncharacterized protein involved in oxidation of intracellular sulfur